MILQILLLLSISGTLMTDAYVVKYPPESKVYVNENELFDREKCKTCCKVMFVSDYNPRTNKKFGTEDDIRYAMDIEFNDKKYDFM